MPGIRSTVPRLIASLAFGLLSAWTIQAKAAGDIPQLFEMSGGQFYSLAHWGTEPCQPLMAAFTQYLRLAYPQASMQACLEQFCQANRIESIQFGGSTVELAALEVNATIESETPHDQVLLVSISCAKFSLSSTVKCPRVEVFNLTPVELAALARVLYFNVSNHLAFQYAVDMNNAIKASGPGADSEKSKLGVWFDQCLYPGAYAATALAIEVVPDAPRSFLDRLTVAERDPGLHSFFLSSSEAPASQGAPDWPVYWSVIVVKDHTPLLCDLNFFDFDPDI